MSNFNPSDIWLNLLIYSSLGVFAGSTGAIVCANFVRIIKKGSVFFIVLSVWYMIIVIMSLSVFLFDFSNYDESFRNIGLPLFVVFVVFSFWFSLTSNKGGPFLSRLLKGS